MHHFEINELCNRCPVIYFRHFEYKNLKVCAFAEATILPTSKAVESCGFILIIPVGIPRLFASTQDEG